MGMNGLRSRLHRALILACIAGLIAAVGTGMATTSAASEGGVLFVSAVTDKPRAEDRETVFLVVAVNCEDGILSGLSEDNFRVECQTGERFRINWFDERTPGIYIFAMQPVEGEYWFDWSYIFSVNVRWAGRSGATVVELAMRESVTVVH